jgi:hypothetical protein
MSLITYKSNFPTKKKKVLFIDADSFKNYDNMNNAIHNFSMNRQICILTKKAENKELIDALIELSMFATVIIFTHINFINKSYIESLIPNYNPDGSVFIGNLNDDINNHIAGSVGLKYSSIIHSGLFEK